MYHQENKGFMIRMDKDLSFFDEKTKEMFLSDLSIVSGVPKENIKVLSFASHCVVFHGQMDREAVSRLVDYYEQMKIKEMEDVPVEMFDCIVFFSKWSVTSLAPYSEFRSEEEPFGSKDAVLFIHGWSGKKSSFGKFPQYIAEEVNCETAVYEYPSGLWKDSPSLEYISRNLDNWIRARYRKYRRLSLVAHSMGGLLVRRLISLQRYRKNKIENINQITFIASPHNGAILAGIGEHVPTLKRLQFQELAPNSPFITSINSDWLIWIDSGEIDKSNIRCVVGTNDQVVSINNAMGLDPYPVPILGAGHRDIVKPASRSAEVVETQKMFLEEASFRLKIADVAS